MQHNTSHNSCSVQVFLVSSLSLQCHLHHTYIDANDANVQHDTQRRAAKAFDIDQHKKITDKVFNQTSVCFLNLFIN